MKNRIHHFIATILILSTLTLPIITVKAAHIPDASPHERIAVTYSFNGITGVSPAHLEGWAITDEDKVSTGKFTVNEDGTIRNMEGELQDTFVVFKDLTQADSFAITIEPEGDTDDQPSGIILMQGPLQGNTSRLSFPVDFTDVTGTYILATPSNGAETNENSGIWFLELPEPPSVGLSLPMLPTGWVYEGWAVHNDIPITSGRFTSPSGADDFDGYSASDNYPPFPGEDFLQNAPSGVTFPIDLDDGTSKTVISVEPDMDGTDPTGTDPFAAKPLVGNIPEGADDHVNYDMFLNLGSLPTGLAVITISANPPQPDTDEEVQTLEERVEELEAVNEELESSNMELQEEANSLQDRVSSLTNSLGTWRMLTLGALVIGLAGGYLVLRLTQHDIEEHHP